MLLHLYYLPLVGSSITIFFFFFLKHCNALPHGLITSTLFICGASGSGWSAVRAPAAEQQREISVGGWCAVSGPLEVFETRVESLMRLLHPQRLHHKYSVILERQVEAVNSWDDRDNSFSAFKFERWFSPFSKWKLECIVLSFHGLMHQISCNKWLRRIFQG